VANFVFGALVQVAQLVEEVEHGSSFAYACEDEHSWKFRVKSEKQYLEWRPDWHLSPRGDVKFPVQNSLAYLAEMTAHDFFGVLTQPQDLFVRQ